MPAIKCHWHVLGFYGLWYHDIYFETCLIRTELEIFNYVIENSSSSHLLQFPAHRPSLLCPVPSSPTIFLVPRPQLTDHLSCAPSPAHRPSLLCPVPSSTTIFLVPRPQLTDHLSCAPSPAHRPSPLCPVPSSPTIFRVPSSCTDHQFSRLLSITANRPVPVWTSRRISSSYRMVRLHLIREWCSWNRHLSFDEE